MSTLNFKGAARWYVLAVVVLVIDQLTKWWASAGLTYGDPWVITGFFNLTLLHNTGAAFSFLSEAGGWQRWFFGVVAVAVSLGLVIWLARLQTGKTLEAWALALVLGGAVGNLVDRAVLGYVVDFLVVHYRHYYWPAFNIADSAICVGAALMIYDSLRGTKSAQNN